MPTYKIVRMFQADDAPARTVQTGLTLEQAQEHCRREDTHGEGWFDGYEQDSGDLDPVPDGMVRVGRLSWRYGKRTAQVWYDGWRGRDRICRYQGTCVTCGRRTYAFDDGENDPRGALGDHAASPLIAEDYERTGPDIPLCFECANDYDRYKWALRRAERRWSQPAE